MRRGVRVAEGARLESVCRSSYRGFESLLLRQHDFSLIAGSCAIKVHELRQVREEATVVIPFVCRRGAWLSFFSL